MIKEREQVIKRLQMQIGSLENCYNNTLERFQGNYPSSANSISSEILDPSQINFTGDGHNNTKINDKAEIILKSTEISNLKKKIELDKQTYEKELQSLSRQLANEEYNSRVTAQNNGQTVTNFQHEKNSLDAKILALEKKVTESTQTAEILKNKNTKLLVRLETVNKYMELLPTREEHIQLERHYNDLEITNSNLSENLQNVKLNLAKSNSTIKEKDDYINSLIAVVENCKIQNLNDQNKINELNDRLTETSMQLDNEERIELVKLKNENKIIKLNLEKAINLNNEVTSKLVKEQKSNESSNSDLKYELAKERAVSETLRQAIIDMQIEKEKLDDVIKSKNDDIISQGKEISSLQIDLSDSNDTFKALHTIKSIENILNTVNHQIHTIVTVIDRQILQNSDEINKTQDIMDISRLLSCSVNNKGEIYKEFNLETKKTLEQDGEILEQPKEKAYDIAQRQLKVAVSLQDEIDKLRLKLSDRWTDHLASNCQIQ